MRVLLIEDEAEIPAILREKLEPLGIEFDVETHAEGALRAFEEHGHDLIVCDLTIPSSSEAPEARKEHGIRVLTQARLAVPGVPVLIFSNFGHIDDLGDLLANAAPYDLYGAGAPQPMLVNRDKGKLPEVIAMIGSHRQELATLRSSIELSGAEAKALMSDLDKRLIAVHARKHQGVSAKVGKLGEGRSGALTLKVEVEDGDGLVVNRVVAKLNSIERVNDEESRYEGHMSLLGTTAYTHKLDTVARAGARDRGAIFYSLAQEYDESVFAALGSRPTECGSIPGELRTMLEPWTSQSNSITRSIGFVRRMLVKDARLPDLLVDSPWRTDALEALDIRIRQAFSHGDLHGGNVLLKPTAEPILIDFGRVGRAVNALDPITLELSVVLHPDRPTITDWPSQTQAGAWQDLDAYLVNCPFPDFVKGCRTWAEAVSAGEREMHAVVYAYGLRQLLYPDTDQGLAAAFSRSAAEWLVADLGT